MIAKLLVGFITTIIVYYWYSYKKLERYFKYRNVKYLPGRPIFGNTFNTTMQRKHTLDDLDRVYRAFPNERYVGFMANTKPRLIIRDPKLIKLITVKDFDHFTDHKTYASEHIDPLFGTSLFQMQGEKWHDMRTTLTPAFTKAKMRHMLPFMVEMSKNIIEYLKEHQDEDVDVDDLMHRYTNDVIVSTSFGLEINSLKDRNNDFFLMGRTITKFNFKHLVIKFLDEQFPNLVKKMGFKIYPKKTYKFFKSLVSKSLEYRKEYNVNRPDMLQLLLETPREWTIDELCAQAFIFFGAGYDTTASILVLTVHELTINPEIQERLYQEIRNLKGTLEDSVITSENLSSLKYLNCVLNETLRKWSTALVLDRKCVKTYTLPPSSEGGKPYVLNPGDIVYNSSNSIHLDPEYWPDPYKYDPDRWSDENSHTIKPFTFQPFGIGPRICIGYRYAIMEFKVLLYYLVLNFKMLKCKKTSEPIELNDHGYNICALGGTWVKFEQRT